MHKSLCVLGRQPTLGLAELESLYGPNHIEPAGRKAALLDLPYESVNFKRLGGSTRLCNVLTELPFSDWQKITRHLAKLLPEHVQAMPEGKLKLGLSIFGIDISPSKLNAAGLTFKKIIRSTGRSVRLVPNQTAELSTAQVLHNNLTGPTGLELVLVQSGEKTILAQTVSVQNIASYTLRDRGRPKRDARVGMLPPKLAQIIINLAAATIRNTADHAVLDPFCGTGVLLQEALLMGYSAYGTDLAPRMVEYSQRNLSWLSENFHLTPDSWLLAAGDATDFRWQYPIDYIASETYLGRPFIIGPSAEIVAQTASEVNLILKKFLQNVGPQIKSGTRLCLALPAWQTSPGKFKHLPLVDQLDDLGYNRVSFKWAQDKDLLYYREQQVVARELLVLTRK